MTTSYRFLHLGINFTTKTATPEAIGEVQNILNKAKDWYRYAPNCWIIYTAIDPKAWNERLKKIPWMTEQRYLICPIDTESKSGWLARDTWEWINRKR